MAHLDQRIAACAAYAFEIGPEFDTRVVLRRNKRESRNANWGLARHRASAPFQNIDEAVYRAIKAHFLVCRGKLHTFPLEDPADHEAVDEPFGVGDGVNNDFQLMKVSSVDGIDYEREIYLPRDAVIKKNGVVVAATVGETGMVALDAGPPPVGHVLTWSGQFDLKVRFDSDYLPFSIDNRSRGGFVLNGSIDLIEVPE